jgi:ectoine hydroxylase-related dioxygenase (phytanoyl-CoA dioxygenase family)
MEGALVESLAIGIREVTDDEVEFFRENGWVKLEKLLSPVPLQRILALAQEHMGAEAETTLETKRGRIPGYETSALEASWRPWDNPSIHQMEFTNLSHAPDLAQAAIRLLRFASVRWFIDGVLAKLPSAKAGSRTPWHQDLPYQPFDRAGAVTIWIPLVNCSPQMGTMRFLCGSQREGLLGRFVHRADGVDMVDYYPHLTAEYPMSLPLDLQIGDATAHNTAVVHSAPDNVTESVRWVYAVTYMRSDVLFTGAANKHTVDETLTVNEPFDSPRFPIVAD